MTPAINLLKYKKISHKIHQYQHDESNNSYGLEAAQKMRVSAHIIYKTLVISLADNTMAVAILPVEKTLNMKKVAKSFKSKKAKMANVDDVLRSTGYILGGVSPLGQKKPLQTILDQSAKSLTVIYVSAGKRGLEIEISPADLAQLTRATFSDICN